MREEYRLDRGGATGGGLIFDPPADAAFVERLKETLAEPRRVKEVDVHFQAVEFARIAVDEFRGLYKEWKSLELGENGQDKWPSFHSLRLRRGIDGSTEHDPRGDAD